MSSALNSEESIDRKYLEGGTVRVCYRKVGEGPALVLLHGYPLSGLTWRKIMPGLSRSFTCYAFDLVGFGGSISSCSLDFSSQGEAGVLQKGLVSLGGSRDGLPGHESRGLVAREVALLARGKGDSLSFSKTKKTGPPPP